MSRLSRRRLMRLRSPRSADMMLQGWLMVAVFARFAVNCALAWRELTRGAPAVGSALVEFSMLHFLLVAFLLAFLSSILSLGAAGLDRRRLALSGVPARHLLPAELGTLVSWPMTFVIAAFLVPAAFPLLRLARPGAAEAGLLLAFAAAVLAGAGLSTLLTLHRAVHRLSGIVRYVFVAALIGLVLVNFDFDWNGGSIRLFVFQHPMLLADGSGKGLLPSLRPWGPWRWIVEGRVLLCAALAAAALAFYAAVTAFSFRKAAAIDPSTARPRSSAQRSARPAGIFPQELRHLLGGGTGAADVAAGLGCAAWLLLTGHPTPGIPLLGGFVILLAGFSSAANLFGRDKGAVRRYAFSGVSWGGVFSAKNAAWLAVSGAACVPLVTTTALRLSVAEGVSLALSAALVLLLAAAWGNVSSLVFASSAASREGPPFINQAAPFLLGGVILAAHRVIGPFGSAAFDAALAACIAAVVVFAAAYIRRVSRSFDGELEGLLEKLRQ